MMLSQRNACSGPTYGRRAPRMYAAVSSPGRRSNALRVRKKRPSNSANASNASRANSDIEYRRSVARRSPHVGQKALLLGAPQVTQASLAGMVAIVHDAIRQWRRQGRIDRHAAAAYIGLTSSPKPMRAVLLLLCAATAAAQTPV